MKVKRLLLVGLLLLSALQMAWATGDSEPTTDGNTVIKSYPFVAASRENLSYDVPQELTVNGKTYKLKDVRYEVTGHKAPVTVTKTVQVFDKASYDKEITETVDGTALRLVATTPVWHETPAATITKEYDRQGAVASELDRADLNVMCGWVITKPKDLPEREERRFFRLCYDFLIQRYGGEQNVVTAAVHRDESGESHLHFCWIPVTKHTPSPLLEKVVRYFEQHPAETNVSKIAQDLGVSRKTVRRYRNCTAVDIQREKVSAKEVVDRAELISFHPDLRAWLLHHGLDANVNSGITMEQGGNRTVAELKQERERLREQHTTTHNHEF